MVQLNKPIINPNCNCCNENIKSTTCNMLPTQFHLTAKPHQSCTLQQSQQVKANHHAMLIMSHQGNICT